MIVVQEVATGEVALCAPRGALAVSALGSCIAVVGLDPQRKAGGIAHIMLPGRAPKKIADPTRHRYAEDGISELMRLLLQAGSVMESIQAILIGAGNVLERPDDTICTSNIRSVRGILSSWKLPVVAEKLGGIYRKRVRLEIESGLVYCGVGDGPESLLWSAAVAPEASMPVAHSANRGACQ